MTSHRLGHGGLIDRSRSLKFSFDGRSYNGHPGDTLASALLANGVRLLGRSFKYHRPRGVMTAGASEPNALVELRQGARREANTRATMVELYDGLIANSQNRWPSLDFDIGAFNALGSAIFVAGFYYKTFMWPKSFWERLYEPLIRRAAGLGSASRDADPDSYQKAFAHCDVLIIGAGPTGLMGALTAARAGQRVIIADEGARLGGSLLYENEEIDGMSGLKWADRTIAELAAAPNVRLMPRTTVFGWYDGNIFGALERVNDHLPVPPPYEPRQRYWRIIAKRAVLAAGAEERPITFGHNDVPGVMLASAVRHYSNRYAAAAGQSVVVFTNNDGAYRTARELKARGVDVAAIVDTRAASKADAAGVPVLLGRAVASARGGKSVTGALLDDGTHLACDTIAISGGWNPIVNLMCHRGARPRWDENLAAFLPPETGKAFAAAGAAAGKMRLSECLGDGAAHGAPDSKTPPVPVCRDEAYEASPFWWVKQSKGKAFVDFQNDATAADLLLAAREGYSDVEQAKRYTTTGMATDQGKLGNINAIAILADATGRSIEAVGTTTFRPFYTPVALGALAGPFVAHHFQPVRKTPLHEWAQKRGAVFVDSGGLWLRSAWFPRQGEDWLASAAREARTTRNSVGICDVSTLGKIDIQGHDAAAFLDRIYCNTFSTLAVGKARYGLMLREDGMALDDGTTSRLAPDHFLMTTTTANAGRVMSHIEFCHQALWPDLDVTYVSVTEQWAQMAVAGPNARATLQRIVDDVVLDDVSFPYLAAKEITVMGGVRARLFRISFSGEHAYELAVPADYGEAAADAVLAAGEEFGITPYGVEALSIMRIEKGHVAGNEFNGTTTAADLGLGRMMSKKKDYIGRAMAAREGLIDNNRPCIVGIQAVDVKRRLRAGSHLLSKDGPFSSAADQGYISSAAWSPMLDRWVGLAVVANGRARHGEIMRVFDAVRDGRAYGEICDPVHFDRENKRLHA